MDSLCVLIPMFANLSFLPLLFFVLVAYVYNFLKSLLAVGL